MNNKLYDYTMLQNIKTINLVNSTLGILYLIFFIFMLGLIIGYGVNLNHSGILSTSVKPLKDSSIAFGVFVILFYISQITTTIILYSIVQSLNKVHDFNDEILFYQLRLELICTICFIGFIDFYLGKLVKNKIDDLIKYHSVLKSRLQNSYSRVNNKKLIDIKPSFNIEEITEPSINNDYDQ